MTGASRILRGAVWACEVTIDARTGDEAAQCGSGNICAICNPAEDGGTDTTGGDGTCQHPCTTDDDCAGTSGPFGETPVCGVNTCGTHDCTIRI